MAQATVEFRREIERAMRDDERLFNEIREQLERTREFMLQRAPFARRQDEAASA